jgi:hypothetical protein
MDFRAPARPTPEALNLWSPPTEVALIQRSWPDADWAPYTIEIAEKK